ncbi:Transposase [Nostoc flagelliforme CCNUN1]|uniref:Transposase n=1 Tax=Nostoc flagelliforme CCNUN1 TaxID=2038116 RepID=A0A2K8T1U7_9NOSO|nr:Transposase [Nostoc flagelliforme CCNUN1]
MNRRKQHRESSMSKAYPSNLTYAQYQFLSEMLPEAKKVAVA